jgi:hypothetical protein
VEVARLPLEEALTENLLARVERAVTGGWSGRLQADGGSRSGRVDIVDGHVVAASLGAETGLPAFRAALVLLGSAVPDSLELESTLTPELALTPDEVLREVAACRAERLELAELASLQVVPRPVEPVEPIDRQPPGTQSLLDREAFDSLLETLLVIDGLRTMNAIIGVRPALTVVREVAELARDGLVAWPVPPPEDAPAVANTRVRETRALRVKRLVAICGAMLVSLGCTSLAMRMSQFDRSASIGTNPAGTQLVAAPAAAGSPALAVPNLLARAQQQQPPNALPGIASVSTLLGPAFESDTSTGAQDDSHQAERGDATPAAIAEPAARAAPMSGEDTSPPMTSTEEPQTSSGPAVVEPDAGRPASAVAPGREDPQPHPSVADEATTEDPTQDEEPTGEQATVAPETATAEATPDEDSSVERSVAPETPAVPVAEQPLTPTGLPATSKRIDDAPPAAPPVRADPAGELDHVAGRATPPRAVATEPPVAVDSESSAPERDKDDETNNDARPSHATASPDLESPAAATPTRPPAVEQGKQGTRVAQDESEPATTSARASDPTATVTPPPSTSKSRAPSSPPVTPIPDDPADQYAAPPRDDAHADSKTGDSGAPARSEDGKSNSETSNGSPPAGKNGGKPRS